MITHTAARGKVVPYVPVLAVSSRFRKYKPEGENAIRNLVVHDKNISQMINAWKLFERKRLPTVDRLHNDGPLDEDGCYASALAVTRDIVPSARDIERFTIALIDFQDRNDFSAKAGFFISALMARGEDNNFVIPAQHVEEKISYLAYGNTKNVVISGSAEFVGSYMAGGNIQVRQSTPNGEFNCAGGIGEFMAGGAIFVCGNAELGEVGTCMENGTITMDGNVSVTNVGNGMKNGLIIVTGNLASKFIGIRMSGGKILIVGDVLGTVGGEMTNGEIHIDGEIGSIGKVIHGKIYHKGKLIVDK